VTQPTDDQVFAALSDSGFLFEQQVAAYLEGQDFTVRVSASYVDPDEQKPREIDVLALRNSAHRTSTGDPVTAGVVIECKSNSAPHVTFERGWQDHERKFAPYQVALGAPGPLPSRTAAGYPTPWDGFGLADPWNEQRLDRIARGSQVLKILRDGGKFGAKSVVHEMAMPAIKATHAFREDWKQDRNTIWFPACITGGKLLVARPDITSSSDLSQVPFACVGIESRARWLRYENSPRVYFDVVPFDSLGSYVDHVMTVTDALAARLTART